MDDSITHLCLHVQVSVFHTQVTMVTRSHKVAEQLLEKSMPEPLHLHTLPNFVNTKLMLECALDFSWSCATTDLQEQTINVAIHTKMFSQEAKACISYTF